MTPDQPQNPYAPPTEAGGLPLEPVVPERDYQPRSWAKSLGLWSVICIISAAPSFVWGISTIAPNQAAAMGVGIVLFILGYTLADQATQKHRWRRNRSARLTLKIGYVTRLIISVIFPVGGFLDMFCGLFSTSAVQFVLPQSGFGSGTEEMGIGFATTLLITIVQGIVLNIVLTGYMAVVFGFVLLAHRGDRLRD